MPDVSIDPPVPDYTPDVEELIDLIARAHIRDGGNDVYTDPMEPWRRVVAEGYSSTPEQAREDFLNRGAAQAPTDSAPGGAIQYSDGRLLIDRPTHGTVIWYEFGSPAFKAVRGQFEDLAGLFGQAFSYPQSGLTLPIEFMRDMRTGLTPSADITAETAQGLIDTTSVASVDAGSGGSSPFAGIKLNPQWSGFSSAQEIVEAWKALAAEIFKFGYLYRIPAFLCGQAMVAKILEDALMVIQSAFQGIFRQSRQTLVEGRQMFQLYPFHHGVESVTDTDWATVLNQVGGVVAFTSAVISPIPGGAVIGTVGGILSGGMSVAANIIGSPEHAEHLKTVATLGGDTAMQMYEQLRKRLLIFLAEIQNTEEVVRSVLSGVNAFLDESRHASGVSFYTHMGGSAPITLTAWESYFAPARPGLADIGEGTPSSVITSPDMMGAAPASGAAFTVDLNGLFKLGLGVLPDIVNGYRGTTGHDVSAGLDKAFTRTTTSVVPNSTHAYTATSTGPALPEWMELYGALMRMINETRENLTLAAEGVVNAAQAYARADAEAAAGLDQQYRNFEELG